MEKKKYPIGAEYYTLYEEVGQGVSASVNRALCIPLNEIVAIKILDFERDNCDLNNIYREAQTMILVDHPNVLKSHCSFVSDHNLWVVMPYMAGGSCLHILKVAYPEGFEEVVIATILREVLKALEYLHHHGQIHRDVKAGNILIDSCGGIKLGDFGVSACLFDSGVRQRMRNTFVGTPCWADIWSFGITALELAHGHAPFSRYSPIKVLLMTVQNAPPGLDYERDNKFSKSFKQMIASCLVKDPSKRPPANKLLKHHFFKQARSNDYIARTLLEGLPALGDRLRALKRKEEDMVAQKKIPDGQREEMSQNEYKRGISGWNFNLEDMKTQAALIQDEDSVSDNNGGSSVSFSALDIPEKKLQYQLSSASQFSEVADIEDNNLIWNQSSPPLLADSTTIYTIAKCEKSDDDVSIASSSHEHQFPHNSSPRNENHIENSLPGMPELDDGKFLDGMALHPQQRRGGSSGCITDTVLLPCKGESDKAHLSKSVSSCNGAYFSQIIDDAPSEIISKASKTSVNSGDLDEKAKVPIVQQKGRFKVTSENVGLEKVSPSPMLQKSHSTQVITQHPAISLPSLTDPTHLNVLGHSLFPMLHSILQTNILQRERILSLMKQVSTGDSTVNGGCVVTTNTSMVEKSVLEAAHDREKELLQDITDLQWSLICIQEELQKYKTENAQI